MLVMGLHGAMHRPPDRLAGYVGHDAAAVLVRDGAVLAAVEEERLCRLKHANYFPTGAAVACVAEAAVDLADVDRFVIPLTEDTLDAVVSFQKVTDPTADRPVPAVPYFESLIADELGVDARGRVRFCGHHLAHALSAVMVSGLDDCLVGVFDGSGDDRSGAVYAVRGGRLEERATFTKAQSLGELYTTLIGVIGYGRFEEYKVMGLAPLGADEPAIDLSGFVRLEADGGYQVLLGDLRSYAFETERALRRRGGELTAWDRAFAHAVQRLLVRVINHVLDHHREATGLRSLCLAGGVVHNCALNGHLARSGSWDRVFVQPAAHDAGAALGAALGVCGNEGRLADLAPLRTLALGRSIPEGSELEEALNRWGDRLVHETVDDPATVAADALADGELVGWVQGRAEFGPRALGQRSLLADPRPAANRDRLNRVVKRREDFRPFAPAVRAEDADDYFEPLVAEANTDFMNFVHRVRPDRVAQLGAVTHVDRTARVQTVDAEAAPDFWALITAFADRTDIPVVLNTSLNGNAEPIVDSVDDAVVALLTLGFDRLVIGDRSVTAGPSGPKLADLVPTLPVFRELVRRPGTDQAHVLASTAAASFGPQELTVSAAAWSVLVRCDRESTVAELCAAAGIDTETATAVVDELATLWGQRAVRLRPPPVL